jgi:hypothetical protein
MSLALFCTLFSPMGRTFSVCKWPYSSAVRVFNRPSTILWRSTKHPDTAWPNFRGVECKKSYKPQVCFILLSIQTLVHCSKEHRIIHLYLTSISKPTLTANYRVPDYAHPGNSSECCQIWFQRMFSIRCLIYGLSHCNDQAGRVISPRLPINIF